MTVSPLSPNCKSSPTAAPSDQHEPSDRLKLQIPDLIELHRPAWSQTLRFGRLEAVEAMPPNVHQCFEEAGLLAEWNDALTRYWGDMGRDAWSKRSEKLSGVGRLQKRLDVSPMLLHELACLADH